MTGFLQSDPPFNTAQLPTDRVNYKNRVSRDVKEPAVSTTAAKSNFVAPTAIQPVKLLHYRRKSANRKLHCGIALDWQSPVWADRDMSARPGGRLCKGE